MISPKCKKLIDDPKETCPHCGVIFAKVYAQKPLPDNSGNQANRDGAGASTTISLVPFLIGGIFIIVVVIWSIFNPSQVTERTERSSLSSEQIKATNNCIAEIRRQARIPESVDVRFSGIRRITRPDGNMSIGVPFKAKNAFGMELENEAICQSDERGTLLGIDIILR